MTSRSHDTIPIWSWAAPVAASSLLGLKFSGIVPSNAGFSQVYCSAQLCSPPFITPRFSQCGWESPLVPSFLRSP